MVMEDPNVTRPKKNKTKQREKAGKKHQPLQYLHQKQIQADPKCSPNSKFKVRAESCFFAAKSSLGVKWKNEQNLVWTKEKLSLNEKYKKLVQLAGRG